MKHAAMRFGELKRLFEAKNPGGECMRFQNGSIGVRYKEGGRLYTYGTVWSHYRLAEKFGLITVKDHYFDANNPDSWMGSEIVRQQKEAA